MLLVLLGEFADALLLLGGEFVREALGAFDLLLALALLLRGLLARLVHFLELVEHAVDGLGIDLVGIGEGRGR